MLNPRPDDEGAENLGGSTRVKGLPVFLLFRMPILFLVGLRPAGAERGVDFTVSSLGAAGDLALRMCRRGDAATGFNEEKSFGEGGARVRKKLVGLQSVSLDAWVPSGCLDRFGERKMTGSMFSLLSLSDS